MYLSMNICSLNYLLKLSKENLTVATRKGFCERKTSPMIASNLKHKKNPNIHWFKALTCFADSKREALKTQRHSITASNFIIQLRKSRAYIMRSN